MTRTFNGTTEDAVAPFLGAQWWKENENKRITGKVARVFHTTIEGKPGICYTLNPCTPVEVEGERTERVSIGNLAGFKMALQAAGLDGLLLGDMLTVTCTGSEPTDKGNDRLNFKVQVVRPDKPEPGFDPFDRD